MLYRFRADLCFKTDVEVQTILKAIKRVLPKAIPLTTGDNLASDSFAEIHKFYHDENPAKPCETIEKVGLK